jgi:hypothetical protein
VNPVDKHIIYMPMKQAVGGYQHVAGGCLCSTGKECEYAKGEECQTWAIVNPADLAKLESDAARVPELEQQAEDARIGKAVVALGDRWRQRFWDSPYTRKEWDMWNELHCVIATAIREAKPNG